jgi:hypothetical protein
VALLHCFLDLRRVEFFVGLAKRQQSLRLDSQVSFAFQRVVDAFGLRERRLEGVGGVVGASCLVSAAFMQLARASLLFFRNGSAAGFGSSSDFLASLRVALLHRASTPRFSLLSFRTGASAFAAFWIAAFANEAIIEKL